MSRVVDAYRRLDRRFMAIAAPWVYLLVPGIAIHELAHAAVGRRWADVEIDWTVPEVHLDWQDGVPVYAFFSTYMAPLWVGGLAALAMARTLAGLPQAIALWTTINWVLLAGPSLADVVALRNALRAGNDGQELAVACARCDAGLEPDTCPACGARRP